jgi:hypothetical protein
MRHRTDLTAKIRTVGLVASFVAAAAIGLTLVADRELSGAVGPNTRLERIFMLAVAGVLWVANLALAHVHRVKTRRTDRNSGTKRNVEGLCHQRSCRRLCR